jgi:hypothetical protein
MVWGVMMVDAGRRMAQTMVNTERLWCSQYHYNFAAFNNAKLIWYYVQLLLTRSTGLAHKLKLYTKRLINSRLEVFEQIPSPGDEDYINTSANSEEDTTQDLLSLKDGDFPLVCTFNYFLQLLENSLKYNIPLAHSLYSRTIKQVDAILAGNRTIPP